MSKTKTFRFFDRPPDGFKPISYHTGTTWENLSKLSKRGFIWKNSVYWETSQGLKSVLILGIYDGVPIEYWNNVLLDDLVHSALLYIKGSSKSYSGEFLGTFGLGQEFLEDISSAKTKKTHLSKIFFKPKATLKKKGRARPRAVCGARKVKVISD